MHFVTKLQLPGLGAAASLGADVARAQQATWPQHTATISDQRASWRFENGAEGVPRGSELRYHPAQRSYIFIDSKQARYWKLPAKRVGAFLAGNLDQSRSNFAIVLQVKGKGPKIAGYDTERIDATISFDWQFRQRDGLKRGKSKIALTIWHSTDPRLSERWGDTLVDFLAMPFADDGADAVIAKLKHAVHFPLQLSTRTETSQKNQRAPTDKTEQPDTPPLFITSASAIEQRKVPRARLAFPPSEIRPASGPYRFDVGGQLVDPKVLSRLPPQPGPKPTDSEQTR